MVWLLNER